MMVGSPLADAKLKEAAVTRAHLDAIQSGDTAMIEATRQEVARLLQKIRELTPSPR